MSAVVNLSQFVVTPLTVMTAIDAMIAVLQQANGQHIPLYQFSEKITPAARQRANNEAVALLRAVQNDDVKQLTPEQKLILSRYTGTGGNLIGEDGLKGSAYEYYTPMPVAQAMWDLLKEQGFAGGNVLDPSSGTGIFAGCAPADILMHSVELSDISGNINKLVNDSDKHATTVAPFEQVAASTDDEIFDAVITNVPFGTNADRGKNKNLDNKYQRDTLEEYFIKRSLDKLRPNGLAAFIVPTKILDNSSFKKFRQLILLRADLVGAYRLPNKVFDATGADVTTDIIILKKFNQDVSEKITNLYENGGLQTLQAARVLDTDIVAGHYFKTYGKSYVLGETVKGKGRFGEVERVVNDDSLANILKLVKRFPESRIDYNLLEVTPELTEITFNDGDIRRIDGATFQMKNGEWQQVIERFNVDESLFATPYALLSGKGDYPKLVEYVAYCAANAKRPPEWLSIFTQEVEKNAATFGFWLCVLSVLDALKTDNGTFPYAERYSALTAQMVGYADAYLKKRYKPKNQDYKRYLHTISIAFDSNMPDGISRFWRGDTSQLAAVQPLHTQAAYENAVYRGIAENWQVDVAVIQQSNPDFDPMTDDNYCINQDGSKVTLKRDYYVGNYQQFLTRINSQIDAATDPVIKEKLIRQKLAADAMIQAIDVCKLNYDLMASTIPIEIKYRYFSEFIDDKVLIDADHRLVLDEKPDSVIDLVKYRLSGSKALETGKMDEGNKALRYFMLNRIFNSINNNQRLYVKTEDNINKDTKAKLLKILTDYYNTLNVSFDAWLKSNDEFMAQLDQQFNAPENKVFPVQLDDSPLTIDGFNPKREGFIALNGYQNEEIRRLSRHFAGMCGFDVGLGKTLTALAAMQNMHNIGIKTRTFVVVPNHTISKWFNDVKMAYDYVDDVLVIGSNQGKQDAVDSKFNAADFAALTKPEGKHYRKILMTVDAFNMIPLRQATIETHFYQTEGIATDRKQDREKQDGDLSNRIKKINKYESKLPYFEDMGVDSLVFDEAQLFKNGKAGGGQYDRIKGLSLLAESALSARAISAAIKSWYIRGRNGELNDGVVLLTATPFTNSPVEILTMLSLAVGDKEAMRELAGTSIASVDDFLSTFANIDQIEQENIVGDLVSVDTFTGFKNVQLLKDGIHKIANIQTARERGLKIPDEENHTVVIDLVDDDKATLNQMKGFYALAKEMINGGGVIADKDTFEAYEAYKEMLGETDELLAHPFNLIARMSDVIMAGSEMGLMRIVPVDFAPDQLEAARKLADQFNAKKISIKTTRRFPGVDSELMTVKMIQDNQGELMPQFTIGCRVDLDDHNSRLILNVDDAGVVAQLMEMIDKAGLQVQPKLSAKVSAMVENYKVEQSTPKHQGHAKQLIFCDNLAMQHVIKRALVAYCGVKSSQIAIINAQTLPDGSKGSPDTEHMQEVQDKFASNEFTTVIANKKAETGIDLQIGTQAIHHLTTGWTPDSLQQRNGRGVRQGNKQSSVAIYHYNANGTFDEYKQRLIAGKADWIDQLMQKDSVVSGTLNVSQELSKQDYEDLINADSPEQIAALLQAKSIREQAERAALVASRTRLLYDNMIKAKKRPKPSIEGQVRQIMEVDAKRLGELIKKRDKAAKPEVIQRYTDQINQIAQRYDGWFDGELTSDMVIKGIERKRQYNRSPSFSEYDIYREMRTGSHEMSRWIQTNADTLTNDVFNRARSVVSTADNMIRATEESFLNYQDNGFSEADKQAILTGEAVLDDLGVLWYAGEYVKAIKENGKTVYGYVKIAELSDYGFKFGFIGKEIGRTDTCQKLSPDDKAAAIEYMVAEDMAECNTKEIFDISVAKPFYASVFPEIYTILAERLAGALQEWNERTTQYFARNLVHRATKRRYWAEEFLPELRYDNPDIVKSYNLVFDIEAFEVNPLNRRPMAVIRNKNLRLYQNIPITHASDSEFFENELLPYLEGEAIEVKMDVDTAFNLLKKLLGTSRLFDMALTRAGFTTAEFQQLYVDGISKADIPQYVKKAIDQEIGHVINNLDEVVGWFMVSEGYRHIRQRIKILPEPGAPEAAAADLMEQAKRVAIKNTKDVPVIGLKSVVIGRDGNKLYENKESLKATVDYAYWAKRPSMWIIDLESFAKLIQQPWYDSTQIEIVEAKYR
ncbi:N-6 DNA methylase [Alkanindiges illinoisensis]|uniref:N-6 DNA methylase n=1 Tax=Alkanindiges illinoisensis TaxID=197183 RepID=UPI00047C9D01|nr:N-6 DNA methylase [Alkanindiges illinoisensis]